MRRDLELWRAEAQLLDCAGSHFIGREEKLASLSACHRARAGRAIDKVRAMDRICGKSGIVSSTVTCR